MDHKLTDIPVGLLLGKFGAGSHKPGSGSASALQGMLSAQLLLTVIDLTVRKKGKADYAEHLPELLEIKRVIEVELYTALEGFFHEDAVVFDLVIELRNKRDAEKDPFKKQEIVSDLGTAVERATEIPISIAECCLRLAEFSAPIFDHGFKSARGDSGVAFTGAISAILGCLNIVELNLKSLPLTNWTEEIIKKKDAIKAQCRKYSVVSMDKLEILEAEFQEHLAFQRAVAKFQRGGLASSIRSDADLEKLVRELQNAIWTNRIQIWKDKTPKFAIQLLRPDIVLQKVLGYSYSEESSLGVHDLGSERIEVAGIIDKTRKVVQVSKNFSAESILFTMAHELGHAVLHDKAVLHRDRSIDGSSSTQVSPDERQANKFAAFFLMPGTVVKDVFAEVFKTKRFVINEASVLALREGNIHAFRSRCESRRGLARRIATADYYGGTSFRSLASIFGVSVETMAIRLEELDLVQF